MEFKYEMDMDKTKKILQAKSLNDKTTSRETETSHIFRQFSEETSCHGFAPLSNSRPNIAKQVIWVFLMLAALVGNCVHFGLLVKEYVKYPTHYGVYFSTHAPILPSVTICNTNPIRSTFDVQQLINDSTFDRETKWYHKDVYKQFHPHAIRSNVGHSPHFIYAWDHHHTLDPTRFTLFQNFDNFNCYTIDNDCLHPGSDWIQALLYVESKQDWQSPHMYAADEFDTSDGVIVILHDDKTMPPQIYDPRNINIGYDSSIFIPVGHYLSIKLSQIVRKTLGHPYNDCLQTKWLDNFSYKYSPIGCLLECEASMYEKGCSCSSPSYPVSNISDFNGYCSQNCVPFRKCPYNEFSTHVEWEHCVHDTYCTHCKDTCQYNKYDMTLKTYQLTDTQLQNSYRHILKGIASDVIGNEYHKELLDKYQNGDKEPFLKWARQHFVEVSVSFNDHKVEVWEEQPAMTLVDLAANIGGSMGLYLGISAITVTEILIFLCQIMSVLGHKLHNKVNTSQKNVEK